MKQLSVSNGQLNSLQLAVLSSYCRVLFKQMPTNFIGENISPFAQGIVSLVLLEAKLFQDIFP